MALRSFAVRLKVIKLRCFSRCSSRGPTPSWSTIFNPSSVPMGVDEEVGGTPPGTIRAARKIERRGRPQPQVQQGLGDAWILIGFIVAVGLIFVVVIGILGWVAAR